MATLKKKNAYTFSIQISGQKKWLVFFPSRDSCQEELNDALVEQASREARAAPPPRTLSKAERDYEETGKVPTPEEWKKLSQEEQDRFAALKANKLNGELPD